MIAPCKPALATTAPIVFLPAEIPVLQQAANAALETTGTRVSRVITSWGTERTRYVHGETPSDHREVLSVFSGPSAPSLDQSLYSARSLIEGFSFLLKSYSVTYIRDGFGPPIYWAGQCAINRLLISVRENDALNGMVPWMNAGINYLIGKGVALEFPKGSPKDKQSAITEVFLSNDSARQNYATAYISQQNWDEYLKWHLGPTSTVTTISEEALCSEEDRLFYHKPLSLPNEKLTYGMLGIDVTYNLTAYNDDLFPNLVRLDFSPLNYPHYFEGVMPLIKSIALERSAAFLIGVKVLLDDRPDVGQYLKAQTEKWKREKGVSAWLSKAFF